ncbi:EcsC family protein [Budvicia aquatica]|uniref:EcsC family protein n=1 Tax=Budvicia aquatica TaxID=82979 RepID=A0A2C6DD84_9GAMM|nr:EcsC family protein [Budvicia aquatica]PHI29146.1 EcsC family protein [Budvicia aquatica]VFS47325.1 EcsC protein family [Budvicia aquatica]
MAHDYGLTINTLQTTLDWLYERAINGIAGLDSAQALANAYQHTHPNQRTCVNALIRGQNIKAGASGFITGLGGLMTLPVTIPLNMTSVLFIQIRMIAAIALLGGHNLKDDEVKTCVYLCLCGNTAKDILKNVGIQLGTRLTRQLLGQASSGVVRHINRAVSVKLMAQVGQKGSLNAFKLIPLVGGVIGGAFDSITTDLIGNMARDIFISSPTISVVEHNDSQTQ